MVAVNVHLSLRHKGSIMTPYDKRPSRFTKRMAEDMRIRNLAQSTVDSYTYHVDRFAHHFGKNPENLGPEEVREFQVWMIDVNKSSFSQFNQAVCALRFFYTHNRHKQSTSDSQKLSKMLHLVFRAW